MYTFIRCIVAVAYYCCYELQVVGEITAYFVFFCHNTSRSITLGVLYGYKMLLQVIALIFAFSIRKVKIRGMNDAKYVGAAVYVTSIVTAVVIVFSYTLDQYINVFAGVFCTGFFIGTTAILGLVMIPPVNIVNVFFLFLILCGNVCLKNKV